MEDEMIYYEDRLDLICQNCGKKSALPTNAYCDECQQQLELEYLSAIAKNEMLRLTTWTLESIDDWCISIKEHAEALLDNRYQIKYGKPRPIHTICGKCHKILQKGRTLDGLISHGLCTPCAITLYGPAIAGEACDDDDV
jgi:hypothetical protein